MQHETPLNFTVIICFMHTSLLTPGSFQIEELIKVLTPLIVIIAA